MVTVRYGFGVRLANAAYHRERYVHCGGCVPWPSEDRIVSRRLEEGPLHAMLMSCVYKGFLRVEKPPRPGKVGPFASAYGS